MKKIDLGKISVSVDDYASEGNAILGIRDSGKSYTATAIAERLMDCGIPIIAFDPIGIWRNLRVPGAGKGYQVVVAGGRHGDLPLTGRSAQEIVRAAIRENVSLIIDLYDIHLSKADWREVVASSIRTLLYENGDHGLRHIFIEEAAEFCPQVIAPDQGRVYAEVEKLARMGGNALLGYTLINQRAEQVNKAVLELCDCMILHRQKGRNSITALSKWLDIASAHESKTLIASLPGLGQGECWVWPAGADAPVRTKVPEKNSFHPDRRARQTEVSTKAKEVDVSAFVATMQTSLEALTKEADDNDPKLLRKEIDRLNRELKKGELSSTKADLAAEYQRGYGDAEVMSMKRGIREGMVRVLANGANPVLPGLMKISSDLRNLFDQLHAVANEIQIDPTKPYQDKQWPGGIQLANVKSKDQAAALSKRVVDRNRTSPGTLSKVDSKFLTVLAQQDRKLTRNQIAIFAGYSSKSSHVDNVLSGLRTKGFIEGGSDAISITGKGKLELGPFVPLPTGFDLCNYWIDHMDKAGAAFLRVLMDRHPKSMTRDQLADAAGYSTSSSHVDNTLSSLRTRDLITGGRDDLRLSDDLA